MPEASRHWSTEYGEASLELPGDQSGLTGPLSTHLHGITGRFYRVAGPVNHLYNCHLAHPRIIPFPVGHPTDLTITVFPIVLKCYCTIKREVKVCA